MKPAELQRHVRSHAAWLNGLPGGRRLDLHDADLRAGVLMSGWEKSKDKDAEGGTTGRADLTSAKMRRANLRGAKLSGAMLSAIDARDAVLYHSKLNHADLTEADLTDADLRG